MFTPVLVTAALLGLMLAGSSDAAEVTNYTASRMITSTADITDVRGYATVTDDGPFTAITGIEYSIAPPCTGPGEVAFSPAPPACEDVTRSFSGEPTGYSPDGRIYQFDGEGDLSIIRRGSDATGDPSLLLLDQQGNVLVFSEN